MKTESQALISEVVELYSIIQKKKRLELKEKKLKAEIKNLMRDNVLLAGEFCVEVFKKTRRSLDHHKIRSLLGPNGYDKISKQLTYESMTVKPIKKARVG